MTDNGALHIPLTPAQSKRLQQLQQQASLAATVRDNVLSAVIEGTTDENLQGWSLDLRETEIVATPPSARSMTP